MSAPAARASSPEFMGRVVQLYCWMNLYAMATSTARPAGWQTTESPDEIKRGIARLYREKPAGTAKLLEAIGVLWEWYTPDLLGLPPDHPKRPTRRMSRREAALLRRLTPHLVACEVTPERFKRWREDMGWLRRQLDGLGQGGA